MADYVSNKTMNEALKKTSIAVKNYVDGKFQSLEDERLETANKTIVGAINELFEANNAVSDKTLLDSLVYDMANVKSDVTEIVSNVTKLETNVTNLESTVTNIQNDLTDVSNQVVVLQEIIGVNESDATPLLSRVQTLEDKMDGDGEDSVNAKIDAKINEFANKITDDGTVNTLKELINYVSEYGDDVQEIVDNITNLQQLVGSISVNEQIANAINNSGHIAEKEAKSVFVGRKYEITNVPVGTLVDYRDKEIRVMCPNGTNFALQNVGSTGNANMYYMAFKAYAPKGAVSFKEGDRGVIVDEMFTFDDDFAGTDEFGRNYSVCWLALASYDASSDTWTYFGKSSSVAKYIGWTYVVEWYDENGVVIASDKIRINLANETCYDVIEPYYVNNIIESANAYTDAQIKAKIPEIFGIEIVEF